LIRARAGGAAAAVAVLVALASGIKDFAGTWDRLSRQRHEFAPLSPAARAQEPGTAQLLPVDAFDFFRARVHKGERYAIVVKPGSFQAGVDRPQAARLFARYYLLPAIQVADVSRAQVVFTVGIDPRSLRIPLGPIEKFSGGSYYAARVA
jgi:hypothetical protein